MSTTPDDVPADVLNPDERRVRDLLRGHEHGPLTLTAAEREATFHALGELEAWRDDVSRRAAFATPAEPAPLSWADALEGVELRIIETAAMFGTGEGSHVVLDGVGVASDLRHLVAIVPFLQARAGASQPSAEEAAIAAVIAEARAVLATVARNGLTDDYFEGRWEPLGDALRELDQAVDALPEPS